MFFDKAITAYWAEVSVGFSSCGHHNGFIIVVNDVVTMLRVVSGGFDADQSLIYGRKTCGRGLMPYLVLSYLHARFHITVSKQ